MKNRRVDQYFSQNRLTSELKTLIREEIQRYALCEIKKRNQHPIEKFAHQCQSACARYV